MAQTLRDECSYSLLTKDSDIDRKHVFFVKLTDSSLKAIEEHVSSKKNATSVSPAKISFGGQSGQLKIPSKGNARQFQFNISSSSQQAGILECIHHANSQSKDLFSFGAIQSKIAVMATEDVYENTKNRMTQADQERKEVCTKEIKLNIDKKKTVKKIHPVSSTITKKPTATMKAITFPPPGSTKNNSPCPPVRKNSPALKPSMSKKTFSLRDRIIHILALRPHKKMEIISRLSKEAMSQKDISASLSVVLKQVATSQGNEYKLGKYWYQELQPATWPFYSDTEREIAKKNASLISSTISKPKAETSPSVSSTCSPDEKKSKRQIVISSNSVPTKKPRIEKSDESPPVVVSTSLTPEYINVYTKITSYEQRCAYKNDFQKEYPEYRQIKTNLDAITRKFMELDESWKRATPGTPEYEKIHDEICSLYEKHQADPEYLARKQRCQELHKKLNHIKTLIAEYDKSRLPDT